MASDNPKYVRLASRLSRGMQADVQGSGWSIAGLDVRGFPEDFQAARYVRGLLNSGVLEPASKSEWDEVHDSELEEEVLRQNPDFLVQQGVQEARIQMAASKASARVAAARDLDEEAQADASFDARVESKKRRLEEQEEAGLNTDDPEEQVQRSSGNRKAKNKRAKRQVLDSEQTPAE